VNFSSNKAYAFIYRSATTLISISEVIFDDRCFLFLTVNIRENSLTQIHPIT